MSEEQPHVTKDGITFRRIPSTAQSSEPGTEPVDVETPAESRPATAPRKPRGRRFLIALGVIVAVLAVWSVADRLADTAGGGVPAVRQGQAAGADTGPAEALALRYERAVLAGDAPTACALEVDPDYCERILGDAPALDVEAAPKVVTAESVTRGDGENEESGVAVLIEFAIAGQDKPQRDAVFIVGEQVVGTDNIGSADAGRSLGELFEADAS